MARRHPSLDTLILGYDSQKKKYVGSWVDSNSTHIGSYEGPMDAAGKALTLEGGAGHDGGLIVFEGTPADLVAARSTLAGKHLAAFVGSLRGLAEHAYGAAPTVKGTDLTKILKRELSCHFIPHLIVSCGPFTENGRFKVSRAKNEKA